MTDEVEEVDPWASKPEPWIILASGTQGHPFRPDPDEIHIEDIAQALSKQCRYNGHIHSRYKNEIYSVGQHSVLAEMLVAQHNSSRKARLGTLLHDSGEQVFGDMLSPVKSRYPQFKADEKAYCNVVFEKYGVPPVVIAPMLHKIIHWADWQMVLMEIKELTAITPELWKAWVGDEQPTQKLRDIDPDFRLWGPAETYDRFMDIFFDLTCGMET